MTPSRPFALFIRGESQTIFQLSDSLGFDSPMQALAVSIFEDGPDSMHVQALYNSHEDAQAALTSLNLDQSLEGFITQLDDKDWVSLTQSGLPPVDAGRFWVYGDHDKDKLPKDTPFPICINAGMAFGTGHHGTTRGCLIVFDELLKSGFTPDRVLDLGCGAGILAIGAAKALKLQILATDIDPDAVEVAQNNAQYNDVSSYISTHLADGFQSPHLKDQKFDLIFANILAGPLMGLAPDIAKALTPSGIVILSGILTEQAKDVAHAFSKAGISTSEVITLNEWTSLTGQLT